MADGVSIGQPFSYSITLTLCFSTSSSATKTTKLSEVRAKPSDKRDYCLSDLPLAINPTRLRQFLDSPNPIERAATLFLLWDKLTEFTDFNRTEDNVFWTEDVPLIGSCVHVDTWTPEGKPVYRNQKADVVQHHNSACMFAFDEDDTREDDTREEYRKIPHDGYLCELANRNRLFDGPARITKSVLTRDGCWKR